MTEFILSAVPWWTWAIAAIPVAYVAFKYFGFNGVVAIIGAGIAAAIFAKGRKAGAAGEAQKQHNADDHARDVIAEKKEDVRAIPKTPTGIAERNRRFEKW